MEIVYCNKCGVRVDPDDWESDRALQLQGGGMLCPKCAPLETKSAAPGGRRSSDLLLSVGSSSPKTSKAQIPAAHSAHAPRRPSARERASAEKDSAVATGMIALAAAAIVFLLAAVYFAFGSMRPAQNFAASKKPPSSSTQTSTGSSAQLPSQSPADRLEPSQTTSDPPHTSGSGSMALSALTAQTSPDEEKEQAEYAKLFDGIKADDTSARIKKLEDFIRRLSPDSDLGPRARVALQRLKAAAADPHAAQVPPPTAEKAVLIGRWKLDEGSGDSAADASGNNLTGKCVNAPQWKDGGLYFDGKDSYVGLPNSQALDHVQEGDYSVCAWFKPEQDPAEEADHIHCGYGVIEKPGLHTGISYYHGGYFTMDCWSEKGERLIAVAPAAPPGVFYHLCGVVSRRTGETRIYVNGKSDRPKLWNPALHPHDFGSATWKIGIAIPGNAEWGWPAKGIIKDVRIYKGALTDSEVQALAREK